jgi:hypothetical protein
MRYLALVREMRERCEAVIGTRRMHKVSSFSKLQKSAGVFVPTANVPITAEGRLNLLEFGVD